MGKLLAVSWRKSSASEGAYGRLGPDFLKPRCKTRPFDGSLICKTFFAKLGYGRGNRLWQTKQALSGRTARAEPATIRTEDFFVRHSDYALSALAHIAKVLGNSSQLTIYSGSVMLCWAAARSP
jgi:hypothetical protein